MYMRKRYCHETLLYELVEFGQTPPAHCREIDGIGWDKIKDGWKKKWKKTVFSVTDSKEEHEKIMHNVYLPEMDPLHSYKSVVHSVPAPWVHNESSGKLTLGLDVRREKSGCQAAVVAIKPESRAKVLAGDIIVGVSGTPLASDEGVLLDGKEFSDVLEAINNSPRDKILTMDVLRSYDSERFAKCARRSHGGLKTTGLDDVVDSS